VTCEDHGDFSIIPKTHIGKKPQGCPQCSKLHLSKVRTLTTHQFIDKAKIVHGDLFDYAETVYTLWLSPLNVRCRQHSQLFEVTPSYHLEAGGCPSCGDQRRLESTALPFSEFLSRARDKFGDTYEYDESSYTGVAKDMRILCLAHGWFSQPGYVHLRAKIGCPICTARIPLTQEDVIARLTSKFGNTLDYSQINFKGAKTPFTLTCVKHSHTFSTALHNLLKPNGNGCKKCALEASAETLTITFSEFLWRARETHGDTFTYKDYINISSPVTVICKEHGEFSQNASAHVKGNGCAQCKISTIERELITHLRMLGVEVKSGDRKTIKSVKGTAMELDLFIPSKNLAIEVNGAMWHSEKVGRGSQYHLHKTEECEKQGIQLIHIFDDEFKANREMVKSKLAYLCGVSQTQKVAARKCTLQEVSNKDYQAFMTIHHLQKSGAASKRVGLYFQGELISAMGFSKPRGIFKRINVEEGEWELIRFATHKDYHCMGALGKMLAWFKVNTPFTRLITFADRRWSLGKGYEAVGFTKLESTAPGYWYCDSQGKRHHRFAFAKHTLADKLEIFDPALTEAVNMANNGYYRIWDCGNLKYELIN